MEEESRQIRFLILIAAVLCAAIVAYHAFYVPEAVLNQVTVTADASSAPLSGSAPESAEQASSQKTSAAQSSVSKSASVTTAKTGEKININTASAGELSDGLDGIGDTLAQRIVEYREQNGPFTSIEQIKNVSGIGDAKFEAIRDKITVG